MEKILLKNKITDQSKIIIPIHWNNNHWFFVTIVDGIIRVFDSMTNHGISKSIFLLSNRLFNKAEIKVVKFPKQQGF
jgi:Ulp1 family protease